MLVTDHQRAGRGRQRRTWHDEPGSSMLMSVLLRPPIDWAPLIPLLAGVAVTDAIGAVVEGAAVALKWPNDVLAPALGDRKVAGILAEAVSGTGGSGPAGGSGLAVILGIGCNLEWAAPPPPEIATRAASLAELSGAAVERWDLVRAVLRALDGWLTATDGEGPAPVLAEYRRRCATIGRAVRFQRPHDVIEGTATAVADDGALVVDTADGPVAVTAGEAHHL